MNYKNEIEKIAAQTMPHRLPNGEMAIPLGHKPSAYSRDEMNDIIRQMYGYSDDRMESMGVDLIPDNLKPVADSDYDTLLADDEGNLSNYSWEEGMITGPVSEDRMTELYTPTESQELTAFGKLDKDTILNLRANKDSEQVYRSIGVYDDNEPKQIRRNALKTMIPDTGKAALMGAFSGGTLGTIGGLRGAGIGAGIGAATFGGAVLANGAARAINPSKAYRNQLSSQAISAYNENKANDEFMSQYKDASEYKAEIEKMAGVEYGFLAANDADGTKKNRYMELDDIPWDKKTEAEDDEHSDIQSSFNGASAYGYPSRWAEKTMARIPFYLSPDSRMADLMTGSPEKYIENVSPMTDYYTGQKDGGRFLTDRDGADRIVGMLDEVAQSLPEERLFDRDAYNKADAKLTEINAQRADANKRYGEIINGLSQKSDQAKDSIKSTKALQFAKRSQLKKELKGINGQLSIAKQNMKAELSSIPDSQPYYDTVMRGSERDAVELYRDALKNSLNDNSNNLYELRWH